MFNFAKVLLAHVLAVLFIPNSHASSIYILESGLVYDGSNQPATVKDIAICGEYFCNLTTLSAEQRSNATRINLKGKVLSPGFIDPHTHSFADLKSKTSHANTNYLFQGVTTVVTGNDGGGPVNISTALSQLNKNGIGTNVGFFVGHGSLRKQVVGLAPRHSTQQELKAMKALLEVAMQEGALGLSSGLYYVPGSFADTQEVVQLAKVAAKYGGIYDTHLRDESTFNIGFLKALEEAIDIAKQANIHLHIAHIKALGVDVWGQSKEAITIVEQAQKLGVSITADQYPWQASGTNLRSALVPKWALADSEEAFLKRLNTPDLAHRMKLEIKENIRRRGGPASLLVTSSRNNTIVGKTLAEISATRGLTSAETVLALITEKRTGIASFNMSNDDITAFMTQPWVVTSSDGTNGHPRKFASFSRKYEHYVKASGVLSMSEFIHRSTGRTAKILGLKNRGFIAEGMKADALVFNPDTFAATADFKKWNSLSTGVEVMFVNGQLVINEGQYTGVLAGQFVRPN